MNVNRKKDIKPKDGIKTSKHRTCIGEITILENTKNKEILILKSDKIKSRLSVPADKRQTQDNTSLQQKDEACY